MPSIEDIFHTRPQPTDPDADIELHMLVCARDFLRAMWSLKSFFMFAKLRPRLVIHDDGTLLREHVRLFREHFIGCDVAEHSDEVVFRRLRAYPMCRMFRQRHFVSRMLFDFMVFSRGSFVVGSDSDILWLAESPQFSLCVRSRTPFYLDGGEDYVRNRRFMEAHCGLRPAENCNTGLIGFPLRGFFDLDFVEMALERLVHVPAELIPESIGYVDESKGPVNTGDSIESIEWWVMEQTLYALLFGRETDAVRLNNWPGHGRAHQFPEAPLCGETATVHYVSDWRCRRFFSVGVRCLIERGFLEKMR